MPFKNEILFKQGLVMSHHQHVCVTIIVMKQSCSLHRYSRNWFAKFERNSFVNVIEICGSYLLEADISGGLFYGWVRVLRHFPTSNQWEVNTAITWRAFETAPQWKLLVIRILWQKWRNWPVSMYRCIEKDIFQ